MGHSGVVGRCEVAGELRSGLARWDGSVAGGWGDDGADGGRAAGCERRFSDSPKGFRERAWVCGSNELMILVTRISKAGIIFIY